MSTQAMTKLIADYFKTQPVVKAWLFGSFARGEETPESDIDILVQYDDAARISEKKLETSNDCSTYSSMRHVLVHGYYKIRPNQLWETIAVDIPQLKPTIERLIKEYE